MNDLEKCFHQHEGSLMHMWDHYFEIFDRHFARYRGRAPLVVESGVSQGARYRRGSTISALVFSSTVSTSIRIPGGLKNPA